MTHPRYEIIPLDTGALIVKEEKYIQIVEMGMGIYWIENVYLFTSIKDFRWSKIISIEGHQWCVVLPKGYQWCETSINKEGYYSIAMVSPSTKPSMMNQPKNKMGKTFPSLFIYKYMTKNYKYKGGGLGESEQGISSSPTYLKIKNTKNGLANDHNTNKKLVLIHLSKNATWFNFMMILMKIYGLIILFHSWLLAIVLMMIF